MAEFMRDGVEKPERSGCLLGFIVLSILLSGFAMVAIISNPRKDPPLGCLFFMFSGSVAAIGAMIRFYLNPRPASRASSVRPYSPPEIPDEDRRIAQGLAVAYAIHEYASDKSEPFYHYSPYYPEAEETDEPPDL